MELRSPKPCPATDLEDLGRRMAGKYTHHRRIARAVYNLAGDVRCDGSRTFSKNNAEIGGSGAYGRLRLFGSHETTDFELSGHA